MSVLNTVLWQFRWPLIAGLTAGTGFAALGSRLLRVVLYGISNLDPAAYVAALAILTLIAVLSVLLPAARTLRLNVAATLHHE